MIRRPPRTTRTYTLPTRRSTVIAKPTAETSNFKELQTYVEILNGVKSDYVEPVEDKTLIENAVRGMLAGLDPHSAYLDEDEFTDMNVQIGRESCRARVCQYV